ncbi:MAG: tetratricopeptide repeat protein [Deltaproteobacteria bacterium]|nr:tetratricopeptide repeat protein [Deltaproteobacteria bacterium]
MKIGPKIKIIIFLGLFIGAFAHPGFADIWNSPSFQHYSRAVTLFDEGNLNECRSELKKSIAEYPQNVPALYLLGEVELRLGREKEALTAFLETEKLYGWTALWSKIAYLYLNAGQLDKAQHSYLKVIKHEPENRDGQKGLAYVLIKQGKDAQALAHLERAFQLDPKNADIALMLADVYERNKEPQKEDAVLSKGFHLTGDMRLGRRLALSLFNRKEYKKASPLFEKLLSSNTTDPEIYYCLGVIQHTQGKNNEARKYLKKAVLLKSDYYEALYNLGILSLEAKDPDRAVEYLKKCTEIRPTAKEAFQQLGLIYETYFFDMKKANLYYEQTR